jgi:tetratricopeptide (TPR) repeat protein
MGHYRKVVETDSHNAQALNNLAYLLLEHANNPDEALKYAQKAAELQPEDAYVSDTLGWVFYRKGSYDMAIKHLESALRAQNLVIPKYHLAMAYAKTGDLVRGRALLRTALKMNPNLPEAKEARELLEQAQAQ